MQAWRYERTDSGLQVRSRTFITGRPQMAYREFFWQDWYGHRFRLLVARCLVSLESRPGHRRAAGHFPAIYVERRSANSQMKEELHQAVTSNSSRQIPSVVLAFFPASRGCSANQPAALDFHNCRSLSWSPVFFPMKRAPQFAHVPGLFSLRSWRVPTIPFRLAGGRLENKCGTSTSRKPPYRRGQSLSNRLSAFSCLPSLSRQHLGDSCSGFGESSARRWSWLLPAPGKSELPFPDFTEGLWLLLPAVQP